MILEEIAEVHKTLTGWCSWQKAQMLATTILSMRPAITVEIGVWGGKSFIPMAMAHKHLGIGTAIGIDPWSQAASVQGQVNPADAEWWSHQSRHDFAFEQFTKKINELALQNVVKIERKPSDEVEPPQNIGLLSLDGNHGEQAIRDVRRFAPNIRTGGLLVFDDIGWSGGSVSLALNLAKSLGFEELYAVKDPESQNFWAVFQKLR